MALFGSLSEKEKRAQETALARPEVETTLRKRPDRLGKYLKKYVDNFVFDEFSQSYLKKSELLSFMNGIPIPLRKEDLEAFHSDKGLSVYIISENMAWILGIDPKFKYADEYLQYIEMNFDKKVDEYLSKEAKDAGEKDDLDNACIHFRAALCIKPFYMDAMYGYARCCKKMYEKSEDEEYIGNFKAEAFEYFEMITEIHPKFSMGYYYLGYMYLNMGLYAKADIAWNSFLAKSKNGKDKKEIRMRLNQIETPLEIEQGCNHVMAQRWQEGLDILESYLDSNYKEWWPLSYYLGVAYISLGRRDEALKSLKNVLKLNPSHLETMSELADIYAAENNKQQEKKYRDKIVLIKKGGLSDVSLIEEDDSDESVIDDGKIIALKNKKSKPKKLEKSDE